MKKKNPGIRVRVLSTLESAELYLKSIQNRYGITEDKEKAYQRLRKMVAKKGIEVFEDNSYKELRNIPGLTEEEIENIFFLTIRVEIRKELAKKNHNFDIEKIIHEDGSIGEVSEFIDLATFAIFLESYGYSQEKTDHIIGKMYQDFMQNDLLKSIGHIILKEAREILKEKKGIPLSSGNIDIGASCKFSKTVEEWNILFHSLQNKSEISPEDKECLRQIFCNFLGAIRSNGFFYRSSLFIPLLQYLVSHTNIATRILAKLMYELAWGCVKDNEPEEVLFMQVHLNRLGKFKPTTTYEEASRVLESLLLPQQLFDFMLSSLEKNKAVGLSSKPTIPFTYEKEQIVEEVREEPVEEGLFTKEEREICNMIYGYSSSDNGADLALISSLDEMSISGAFAILEDIGRNDLKEKFLIYRGKNLLVDLHALEELYAENPDEGLVEEKDDMMHKLRNIEKELHIIREEKAKAEEEKNKELYYFTRLEGEDSLTGISRLDKQHKKNLAVLLGKLQSRKTFGYAINSNCYFLGGDDVILYYTVLSNGMYCILRIFPGAEINTSREFLKDASFWDELNALKLACEKQDHSWEYYLQEGEKAKKMLEELKCSPALEKK